MEKMTKLGPKCMKGKIWDEGGKSEIVQIIISYSDSDIKSIQFVYVQNNKVCCSKVHGEPSGSKLDVVTLDYPSEILISVSVEIYPGVGRLASLAFRTNKGNYGPFGSKLPGSNYTEKFSYEFGPSFGGFHGSVRDNWVEAIGVYVKPIDSLAELKRIKREKI